MQNKRQIKEYITQADKKIKELQIIINRLSHQLEESKANIKPPMPQNENSTEYRIWRAWEDLKYLGVFSWIDVADVLRESTNSNYISVILSSWAKLGYLTVVKYGAGPKPCMYKII